MANHKAMMPDHVRQFCISEMRAYPEIVVDKGDAMAAWTAISEEGGNLGKLDIVGRVDGGAITSSPTESYHDKRTHALTTGTIGAIMKRCGLIEDVLVSLFPPQWEAVVGFYWYRLSPEEIEKLTQISPRSQGELRTKVLVRLARSWGMI